MNKLATELKDQSLVYCLPDFSRLSLNEISRMKNYENRGQIWEKIKNPTTVSKIGKFIEIFFLKIHEVYSKFSSLDTNVIYRSIK